MRPLHTETSRPGSFDTKNPELSSEGSLQACVVVFRSSAYNLRVQVSGTPTDPRKHAHPPVSPA